MQPRTWQRIYAHASGPEYPADPATLERVLRSMVESGASESPFRVRLRMPDGSMVVAKPKGWKT